MRLIKTLVLVAAVIVLGVFIGSLVGQAATIVFPNAGGTGVSLTTVTKGDLLIGSSTQKFRPLAVGANGTVLTASSSALGGIAWASSTAASSEQCRTDFLIENPTATEDNYITTFNTTSTITKLYSVHKSTGDAVTFNFIWAANRTAASSSVGMRHLFTANATSTATTTVDVFPTKTAFASTTVDAGMVMRQVTSVASSTQWGVTLCWTEN